MGMLHKMLWYSLIFVGTLGQINSSMWKTRLVSRAENDLPMAVFHIELLVYLRA